VAHSNHWTVDLLEQAREIAEWLEIPRSGFAGAVTFTPFACSRSITLFQLGPSANAPCTGTTVGEPLGCAVSDVRAPQ
jgi:hypothetical protein